MSETSSHFSHVLDTNYVPTRIELLQLRNLILEPEKQIRALEEEIRRLQAKRDELESYVARHRMLLSPFRRFPSDIWREIFMHTLPNLDLPCRTLKEAPLLLTVVCRSWREIALNTPRLWNSIHVCVPILIPKLSVEQLVSFVQQRKRAVRMWLNRSGALGITISINLTNIRTFGTGPEGRLENSHITDFTSLLVEFSRRLKSVRLSSSFQRADFNNEIWKPLATLTGRDLPILEEIRVEDTLVSQPAVETFGSGGEIPFVEFLAQLTSLRSLTLCECSIVPLLAVRIRWDNLTHLRIHVSDEYNDASFIVATIARMYPLLSTFKLTLRFSEHPTTPSLPSTPEMPQAAAFRCFELDSYESPGEASPEPFYRFLHATFQSIISPNLEELKLDAIRFGFGQGMDSSPYEWEGYDPGTTPFHDLLVRSNPRITRLAIDEFVVTYPWALRKSLELVPNLASLQIRLRFRRSRVVRALQLLIDESTLCPEIEEIEMDGSPGDVDTILAFIDARPRLKFFSIDFGGNIVEGSVEEGLITSKKGQRCAGESERTRGEGAVEVAGSKRR